MPKNKKVRRVYDYLPQDIAKDWFKHGKKAKDEMVQFMTYWVAFSNLYESYYYEKTKGKEKQSERDKIKNYLEYQVNKVNKKNKDRSFLECFFEEFDKKDDTGKSVMGIFEKFPVFEGKFNPESDNYKDIDFNDLSSENIKKIVEESSLPEKKVKKSLENYNDLCQCENKNKKEKEKEKEKVIALFMTIYQIRCNLFHGQKGPIPERNVDLVGKSAKILEFFLKEVMS